MFQNLKNWLILRFLPAWAKDQVYQENERLRKEISLLRGELRERDAYIDGLERGVRAQRRIIINNGVAK